MFSDGSDDQQSGLGFQRGIFWQWKAVQTRTLASGEELHQPVQSRALRHRKENVHRSASCRTADPVGFVLGTFTFQCSQILILCVKCGSKWHYCMFVVYFITDSAWLWDCGHRSWASWSVAFWDAGSQSRTSSCFYSPMR